MVSYTKPKLLYAGNVLQIFCKGASPVDYHLINLLSLLIIAMSIRQKRYQAYVPRGLLLAGYLFLFASQFNYRYFTIANFCVYGSGHSSNAGSGVAQLHMANRAAETTLDRRSTGQHPVALHDNSQRPSHLGIDKRFRFKQGVRVPQIRAPGEAYPPVVKTRFYTLTPVCFSTDLPTLSLRGPPTA